MTESAMTDAGRPAFPLRQKLLATAVHLLVSVACVGALLLLVTQVWYPDYLFRTDGGRQGLRIVILVDLVLGPLLTFVVFRRGKKGLVLDLTLIAIMQLSALLGGGWLVYSERPLLLVFHEGRFYSVTADDYLDAGVPVPDLSGVPARPPGYVVLSPPDDPIAQSPVRLAYMQRRQFLYSHVPWMRPAEAHRETVLAAGIEREMITAPPNQAERIEALEAWERETGLSVEDLAVIPYASRYYQTYLVVDRTSGRILDELAINSR